METAASRGPRSPASSGRRPSSGAPRRRSVSEAEESEREAPPRELGSRPEESEPVPRREPGWGSRLGPEPPSAGAPPWLEARAASRRAPPGRPGRGPPRGGEGAEGGGKG